MPEKRKPTAFGLEMRKFRIDLDLTVHEMGHALGVSGSYLCAVELGRKRLTQGLLDRIVYYLNTRGVREHDVAVLKTCAELLVTDVNLEDLPPHQRLLIIKLIKRPMTMQQVDYIESAYDELSF